MRYGKERIFRNLDEFNRNITRHAEKLVPEKIIKMLKKIGMEALKRIVLRTPVDTGRARGNWQVSINFDSSTETDAKDKSGRRTRGKGNKIIGELTGMKLEEIVKDLIESPLS